MLLYTAGKFTINFHERRLGVANRSTLCEVRREPHFHGSPVAERRSLLGLQKSRFLGVLYLVLFWKKLLLGDLSTSIIA